VFALLVSFLFFFDSLEVRPKFVGLSGRTARRMRSSFGAQIDYDNADGPIVLQVMEGSARPTPELKGRRAGLLRYHESYQRSNDD